MTQCARCGASIAAGNQFCTACGAPAPVEVGAPAAPWGGYAQPTAESTAPPPYTPPGAQYSPPQYVPPAYAPLGPPPKPLIRPGFAIAAGVVVVGFFMLLLTAAGFDDSADESSVSSVDRYDFDDDVYYDNPTSPMTAPLSEWDALWVAYEDPDGQFRAEFPSKPVIDTDYWRPLPNLAAQDVTIFNAEGDTFWVSLEYYQLPAGAAVDAPAVAEEAARYASDIVHGTLTEPNVVSQDGRAAFQYHMTWKDDDGIAYASTGRTIVDGDNLYVLSVSGITVDADTFNRTIDRFEPLGDLIPSTADDANDAGQKA